MRKCLPLNLLEPTRTKRRMLRETYSSFLGIVKEALSSLDGIKSRGQLHRNTYEKFRGKHCVASQLVIEATSYAWTIRNRRKKKTTGSIDIRGCVVRFNHRLFSFKETKRRNPVLSIRTSNRRTGLPVSRDGAYHRLQAHLAQGWEPTSIIMSETRVSSSSSPGRSLSHSRGGTGWAST